MASFPERQPIHEAVIAYEERVLQALPRAYNNIRIAQRHLQEDSATTSADASRVEATMTEAEARRDHLISELEAVREWLDAFVRRAEEYVAERPERRGQILPPSLPASTLRYDSIEAFVAEEGARGVHDWDTRKVAAGADFGYDWTWQDPERPWVVSTWRVSYIDELSELYACENALERYRPYVSFDGEDARPRSVLLIASNFAIKTAGDDEDAWGRGYFGRSPTWDFLSRMQSELMRQRNSLVLLANAVVTTQ